MVVCFIRGQVTKTTNLGEKLTSGLLHSSAPAGESQGVSRTERIPSSVKVPLVSSVSLLTGMCLKNLQREAPRRHSNQNHLSRLLRMCRSSGSILSFLVAEAEPGHLTEMVPFSSFYMGSFSVMLYTS